MTIDGDTMIPCQLRENDVVLYVTGTLECARAAALLRETGVRFVTVGVETEPALAQSVAEYSGWPTFPQLFVQAQFIGGLQYVEEMARTGALQHLLRDLPRSLPGN
ncbi:MAG: monothiol glutaredoxin, Grx4 family [Armatimonadetes bacterium]|nr:monothiol glutaredoxin, Grx4 family [Armatimonadota bacterium]